MSRSSRRKLADLKREVTRLKRRAITPGAFLLEARASLVSDQLTDLGNAFAVAYYNGRKNDSRYYEDYEQTFRVDDEDFYRVPDSWRSLDRLKPVIARRHRAWLANGKLGFVA